MDQMKINLPDTLQIEIEETHALNHDTFYHRKFEERLAAYNNRISVCSFDWGEPKGREML